MRHRPWLPVAAAALLSGCPSGCPSGPRNGPADASLDAGDTGDASDASASDGSPDAGDGGRWPWRITGGCTEVRTVKERTADHIWFSRVAPMVGGFVVLTAGGEDGVDCRLRVRDLDGELVSEVVLEDRVCEGRQLVVSDDARLMVLDGPRPPWIGSLDGDGDWADVDWPALWRPGFMDIALASDSLFLSAPAQIARLDWTGDLVAYRALEEVEGTDIRPILAWTGSVLGAIWQESRPAETPGEEVHTAYLQRFDADLLPLDPEPQVMVELFDVDLQRLGSLTLGWDGSQFGVVVQWWSGHGDWGEPPLLDVFRYSEEGELLGSFPVYRGGVDEYMHRRLWWIFPVPGRMIFIHDATYFDGEVWDETFEGVHAGAIDLSTGEPVGEDAQLPYAWMPHVRSGNRLALLWAEREYTDEARTEWIEHQNFTILDCTGLLGDL